VEEEGEAAILGVGQVGEGDEVGPHGTGEAERGDGGTAPEEGLAGGEGEREGKVGRGERERMPLFLRLDGPGSEGEAATGGGSGIVVVGGFGFGGLYGRDRRRGRGELWRRRREQRRSDNAAAARRHGGDSGGEGRRPWKKREAHRTLRKLVEGY
jgi:hypothetical protein